MNPIEVYNLILEYISLFDFAMKIGDEELSNRAAILADWHIREFEKLI